MFDQKGHIHFIAIGGSAMHNLAIALKQSGYTITGSDDDIFEPSRSRLLKHGLLPEKFGWYPEKLNDSTRAVILGMHARTDNPEMEKALSLGLKIYSYPDFIYEASKNARRVVIAGSHGKTTITSIIMHVLNFHQKDFDYLVGAGLPGFSNMVKLTNAPMIILEGDEYLSSALDKTPKFIRYNHNIGLISGISWDHINAFPTRELYNRQFEEFINNTPENGHLIYFSEDNQLNTLVKKKERKFNLISYSTPAYEISNNQYFLKIDHKKIPLKLFGKHNMQNLAGAIKVLQLLGIEEEEIFQAIETFEGASNRLEQIFDSDQILVFKDFAHSPSKLKSTTDAINELYPDRRIISCFELHTYSSLNKDFLKEYRNCFPQSDQRIVFVNDHTFKIKKMPPLSDNQIKKGFNEEDLTIIRSLANLEKTLKRNIKKNTVFLFMSSGNFGGLKYSEFTKNIVQYLAK